MPIIRRLIFQNSSNFFRGAALLYLLPIVALVIGAFLGAWGGGQIGWQQTTGAVLGAIAGIGIAVLVLIRLDRSQSARRSLTPAIVEILPPGVDLLCRQIRDR